MNKKQFLIFKNRPAIVCIFFIILLTISLAIYIILYIDCKKKVSVGDITRTQSIYDSGFNLTSCEQITEEDVYQLCLKIRDKNPEQFDALLLTNKFHGHTGMANIYGAVMALYAKQLLNGKNYSITVVSEAGDIPPKSCFNDGVQAAINATYGRALIQSVPNVSRYAATFLYLDKWVRIEVKEDIAGSIDKRLSDLVKKHNMNLDDDYYKEVRELSLKEWETISNQKPEDIFTVTGASWMK